MAAAASSENSATRGGSDNAAWHAGGFGRVTLVERKGLTFDVSYMHGGNERRVGFAPILRLVRVLARGGLISAPRSAPAP